MQDSLTLSHPSRLFSSYYFREPAVRHLAWLILGPSLITDTDPPVSQPMWPKDITHRLQALDQSPQPLLDILGARPVRRLGLYFEQLYRYALEHLLGWEVVLQNQPLITEGRTFGELDFIVRDPATGATEHHEIAVKFYLGWPGEKNSPLPPGWYGPDTRDQLSNKLDRLQRLQGRRTELSSVQSLLATHHLPQPRSRLVVRGTLFYPRYDSPPPLPEEVCPSHERGFWCRLPDYSHLPQNQDTEVVPLIKPDWLGPFQCTEEDLPDWRKRREEMLARVTERVHPHLFACLERQPAGHWLEQTRFFITPGNWPDSQ